MLGLSSPRFDRDQRGLILSSPLALMTAGLVLLAGVGYFVTSPSKHLEVKAAPPVHVAPLPTIKAKPTPKPKPVVRRQAYVVVFNNSAITGLAGRTSAKLAKKGWNVVGSDNWYGNIPASTVYFPASLKGQADLLAGDLGIHRVKPSIDPMRSDRLTVILTSDRG